MDTSAIKSEKLKKLIENSAKFHQLSESEQREKIKKLAKLPAKKQEEIFCPFFEKENTKEKAEISEKRKIIAKLSKKLEEMQTLVKKLARTDAEQFSNQQERAQEEKLLKDLNSV